MTTRDLIEASAKPVILSLLAEEECFGYQILLRVRLLSGGASRWSNEMLAPILQGLERDGLIGSSLKASPNGTPLKRYRLTGRGRRECAFEGERGFDVPDPLDRLWIRVGLLEFNSGLS